jgi:hypothetical protein
MKHCKFCDLEFSSDVCPRCGSAGSSVSVADDSMDSLVQAASVPNLADLFRKAKATGAIAPMAAYGEGAPSS